MARTHEDYAFQDFWLGLVERQSALHDSPPETARAPRRSRRSRPNTLDAHRLHVRALRAIARLYVNGNRVATVSTDQDARARSRRASWSAPPRPPNSNVLDYFSGAIDDVRIWNRTLTARRDQRYRAAVSVGVGRQRARHQRFDLRARHGADDLPEHLAVAPNSISVGIARTSRRAASDLRSNRRRRCRRAAGPRTRRAIAST